MEALVIINNILWHDIVLILLLITGVLFTVWSRFSQYRVMTHGVQVLRGTYDDPMIPGRLVTSKHFLPPCPLQWVSVTSVA